MDIPTPQPQNNQPPQNQPIQNFQLESQKSSKKLMTILIIVFLLLAAGAGAYWYFTQPDQIACTQEAKLCPDGSSVGRTGPNCEYAVCPAEALIDCGSAKKFVSSELGIAFCYPEKLGDREVIAGQSGNKVYVDGKNGQSVEVFTKDRNDTLEQAIEKTFLKNYSKDKCFVEKSFTKDGFPVSYLFSPAIAYPKKTTDEPYWISSENCPKSYSQENGISYFLADKNHCDKFLYFSIGQYGIPLDSSKQDSKAWQDTIKFLDSSNSSDN